MVSGVNLAYKDAEYTIIPKIPFGDITDPIAAARAKNDPEEGIFATAQRLEQMLGRAFRAADDQNEVLITDIMFKLFLAKYKYMLSPWVRELVHCVDVLPEPLEAL
jgi:hypothetical protein